MDTQIDRSGLVKEYEFLNTLTITRINTTHYIWIGSLVAEGVILQMGLENGSPFILAGSILLMIPFILSMAFQLDSIAKIRSYISVYIDPVIGAEYDLPRNEIVVKFRRSWSSTLAGAPFVLLMPYIFYLFISLMLSFLLERSAIKDPIYNAVAQYKYYAVTAADCAVGLLWSAAAVAFLFSARVLVKSHGLTKLNEYISIWKASTIKR
jgi:hypothetical protein